MTPEATKQLIRRWYESAPHADIVLAAEAVRPDCLHHLPGMPPLSAADHAALMDSFRMAFPDLAVQVHDILTEDDRVVLRGSWSGTQSGAVLGIPATGKSVHVKEMHAFRVSDGQIAEHWVAMDQLSMLQQLGVLPAPPTST